MRRASALLMALWVIAVLSIMVLSFAYEARQQTGINVYVRERNRVNRLVDAGRILAEVVIADYANASEWAEDPQGRRRMQVSAAVIADRCSSNRFSTTGLAIASE